MSSAPNPLHNSCLTAGLPEALWSTFVCVCDCQWTRWMVLVFVADGEGLMGWSYQKQLWPWFRQDRAFDAFHAVSFSWEKWMLWNLISIRLNFGGFIASQSIFCTWMATFKETKSKSNWVKCWRGTLGRHRCPLCGDRCYRFIYIDSAVVLVYQTWPCLLCCQALRYNRMPFFYGLWISMELISGHALVSSWILLLLMSTPSGY